MTISDMIGSSGVVLMLFAFLLNIIDRLDKDHPLYITLNIIGGVLACTASCMIQYEPFIILEATWTLISMWALYDYFKKRKNGKTEKDS
jgi:hypothetical protein